MIAQVDDFDVEIAALFGDLGDPVGGLVGEAVLRGSSR